MRGHGKKPRASFQQWRKNNMFVNSVLSNLGSTLGVVFAFGLVIFIHEFGHFFVAKRTGVKVEAFAFGFGKEIFGFTKGETRYSLNWIPLGGYVRMAGEQPDDYEGPVLEGESKTAEADRDKSREFMSQPWYRRIPIVLAGPAMNYVLSIAIFFAMLMIWGQPVQTNKTQVGNVVPDMPAAAAGLKTGDSITSVAGQTVTDFAEVATIIHGRADLSTEIKALREGSELTFNIVPKKDQKRGIGLIGIQPAEPILERTKVGVFASAKKAVWQCWNISSFTIYYLGKSILKREKPDVAGPIGIVHVVAKAAKSGLEDLFYLIGMISCAIGLFNLFPIPLLDGGHLAYYVIEGIRGKPLSQKTAKLDAFA
jgi:regulator of sigma E protease